eukprot:5941435-Alexandrium_andersonii.AAC.1
MLASVPSQLNPPSPFSGGEGRSDRLRMTHRGCARMPLSAPVTVKPSPPGKNPDCESMDSGSNAQGRA